MSEASQNILLAPDAQDKVPLHNNLTAAVSAMKSESRGIQSVEIAGQILRVLVDHSRPLTLSEIAERAGTTSAQIHNYLVSMTRVGLLKRDPQSQKFEPGALALRLGVAALHSQSVVEEAIAHIAALGQRLNVNMFLSVWGRFGPLVIDYREHGAVMNIGFRLGSVLSLTQTATGKLFAAYHDREQCTEVINQQMFTRDKLDDYLSPAFQQQLAAIRRDKISIAQSYPLASITSLAVPVFAADNSLTLTISAFAAAHDLIGERLTMVSNALQALAVSLSCNEIAYESR
ncbi:IclR family transcriptional regulator [Klebsiella quasipneumoniae]|uniref:IclR family transcriptional regulator n=1 Tax=Klebsiella quasipneumoniae TaxID=1463165 RepID=UPI00228FA894|nr:IclR family transcriptional regulator [Klebsiella quasipneumoniae]